MVLRVTVAAEETAARAAVATMYFMLMAEGVEVRIRDEWSNLMSSV